MTISEYCRRVIINRVENKKIRCLVCDHQSRVGDSKQMFDCGRVIEHALVHLHKEVFWCQQCDFRASTKGAIRHHLKKKHTQETLIFEDKTEDYHDEIKAVIDYCYGGSEK